MKKQSGFIYFVAAVLLIIVGIGTTAIIASVKNKGSSVDIRAKAGVTNTLKLTGTVSQVDEVAGTILVSNVQFDQESRSGDAKNYGTWTVTPPLSFSLISASVGSPITFTVETSSFNVATKKVSATQVTVGK